MPVSKTMREKKGGKKEVKKKQRTKKTETNEKKTMKGNKMQTKSNSKITKKTETNEKRQKEKLSDPTEILPPLSRDGCSNTPVALCFLWYRRLSLLHPHFFQ